jgi:hypothetical protein
VAFKNGKNSQNFLRQSYDQKCLFGGEIELEKLRTTYIKHVYLRNERLFMIHRDCSILIERAWVRLNTVMALLLIGLA